MFARTLPHTSTTSLPQGAPEFDFAYIQAKCDAPTGKPAKVYANMIYQTLRELSKDHLSNVKPNDVKGALAGVHLIMYNWGDNGGSTPSSEAVMTRLAVMEQSAKSESDMEKGMHVRTAMTFVGQHFDSNVQTVARPRLDTWLIPSLRVFPRLVAAIEKT